MRPKHTPKELGGSRYVIEGRVYGVLDNIYAEAITRGFNGTLGALTHRLRHGVQTWDALAAPVSETMSCARKASAKRSRDEMAEVIAALDARKEAMR